MSTGRGTRTATLQREQVAAWPRISAIVRSDGTGALIVNGTERPCTAPSVEELRTGMIARCAGLARRLRRPVRLNVHEGTSTWTLAVRARGVVQLVDDDGKVPPADGLLPHEGRCRSCRRLQPVTQPTCLQCGTDEPHRVEADPLDERNVVPDAANTIAIQSEAPPMPVAPTRALRLTFSTQPHLVVTGGVALGRNPEPIGGRQPIKVASPERALSRTHALIDLDDEGRIIVVDNHSGNGTEAQTQPPAMLEPGIPYVLHEGTTLLLGDVSVVVSFA